MIQGFFQESIIKRAQEKGHVEIALVQLRDFALDSYGTVDDRPYGGGAGMVMRPDVVSKAISSCGTGKKIFLTPKGETFSQKKAVAYSKEKHIILFAGHYEDIDARAYYLFDETVSLGDFVLTGGEVAAAAIADSVVRLLPGVLKKNEATVEESFSEVSIEELMKVVGPDQTLTMLKNKGVKMVRLLEYPQYTRPELFENNKVPEVLLSGHTAKIREWKLKESYFLTKKLRKDLLKGL